MLSADHIKRIAAESGFDACGIARYRILQEKEQYFLDWIDHRYHAGMDYLTRNMDKRIDPALLLPDCRSVIVCLKNYPKAPDLPEPFPRIASYARSTDYHISLKFALKEILTNIKTIHSATTGRIFVDSAPVLERDWAIEAGLGNRGKNSLLIHPGLGSRFFIGILVLDTEVDRYDTKEHGDPCGVCTCCIDNCPGKAILPGRCIDANRCLSYHTVESREEIPKTLVPRLGNRLFGCDTCLDCCPHNIKNNPKPATEAKDDEFHLSIKEWLEMTDRQFERRFGHTPLSRRGLGKLRQTIGLIKQKND